MDAPTSALSAVRSRIGIIHEAPPWQRDNKYILGGYRGEMSSYLDIIRSLTFLHNETCNVYTHLAGAILLPLIAIDTIRTLSQSQFSDVSTTDYTMFAIFFWSAECCLLFSTMYHLVGPYSYKVEKFWHRMDLFGIVIVTIGTFIPSIYYIFFCTPALQRIHWCIVSCSPRLRTAV